MKALLVALNSQYIHSNLAIRYLRAYTKDMDYNCVLKEFTINNRIEQVLEGIMEEKPDFICFSTYIWNVDMVKALSHLIKRIDSKIEILYGGPEVSFDSEEFLKESNGDYVIKGEGEKAFREFIEYKLKIRNINSIKGFYYSKNGEIFFNENRENMDMNEIVFPYEECENLENKIVYYEGSRGCPFRCKYCLSSTDRNLRFLNIERIKKELQFFIDKKVKLVKFVDRTFNANHDFAMAIWEYLIKNAKETSFHFEISADILKKDEIELLKSAPSGLFQFEVGVQSTNNTTLRHINRMVNFSSIEEKVVEIKNLQNIKQHLDLIAGLPGEDLSSFINSFNDVYSIEPEEIQLGFLKLLKGSNMREEAGMWGMEYSPYPPYEILKTSSISYEELVILKRVEAMVDKYYNSGKFHNIIKYFINIFPNPFDFYLELSKFFKHKGYFNRNISSTEYYKVFLDFNKEILKRDNNSLKEIIKYDYLTYNKRSWVPDFIREDVNRDEIDKVKEILKQDDVNINFSKVHIQKFNLDMELYIQENVLKKAEVYVIFYENKYKVKFITNIDKSF